MTKEVTNQEIELRIKELNDRIIELHEQLKTANDVMKPLLQESLDYAIEMHDTYTKQMNVRIGRPSLGVTKKVSITLPAEDWERLEVLKDFLQIKSTSELMRYIIGLKLDQEI